MEILYNISLIVMLGARVDKDHQRLYVQLTKRPTSFWGGVSGCSETRKYRKIMAMALWIPARQAKGLNFSNHTEITNQTFIFIFIL